METRLIHVDTLEELRAIYREAADLLEDGQLVAIPTETVYGLGADAFNAEAVARIFEVKQRPLFDPIICHMARREDVHTICDVPAELLELVTLMGAELWPGPLTMVLPKKPCVPDIVTSGLDTVAVRVPAHDVMRGVARTLGRPIAAPSANMFGNISPTSAKAVLTELNGLIPMILDAGACSDGIESTIVAPCIDAKGEPALHLLREGPVTREQLRKYARVIRPKKISLRAAAMAAENAKSAKPEVALEDEVPCPSAPGQLASHYAPKKPLFLCASRTVFEPKEGVRYGLVSYQGDSNLAMQGCWENIKVLSPGNGRLSEAAIRLFAFMRALDEDDEIDVIIAEELPEVGIGYAMMDRLRRAAVPRS